MTEREKELAEMLQQSDNFTKWMLGISATVIVAMGGALFSTVVALREDMAVIKNELGGMKETITKLDIIQSQVSDHEYRLQWMERAGDNTRADGTTRRLDTLRRTLR
jgi:hypothetical protein